MVDIQKAAGDAGEYLKVSFQKPYFYYLVNYLTSIYDQRYILYVAVLQELL